jgi:hypothetical protein
MLSAEFDLTSVTETASTICAEGKAGKVRTGVQPHWSWRAVDRDAEVVDV